MRAAPPGREGEKEALSLLEGQPMARKDYTERDSKGLRCCLTLRRVADVGCGQSSCSETQNPTWPEEEAESRESGASHWEQ